MPTADGAGWLAPWSAVIRSRRAARLGIAALLPLYLLSGIYFVPADQQVVVVRFGKIVESRVPAGVHWTWPVPVSRVHKLRVRESKRLTVGLDPSNPSAPVAQSQVLTGDRNILSVRVIVQFAINDPAAYLFRTPDINALVENTVRAALVQVSSERHVDDLLTSGKVAVQERVQELAQASLTRYDCGVSLLAVVLDEIRPPDEVIDAFRQVASAREDSGRVVREAESYANGVVPKGRGDAAKLGEEAMAYNTTQVNTAQGDASRFSSVAAEHAKAPLETETRLYLETMEEVLPRMDKTIVGTDPKSVDLQFLQRK